LVVSGHTLYVGGTFVGVSSQSRTLLAAVDIPTGQVLPFDARVSGIEDRYGIPPEVAALAMVGDTLYVGGNFTQIGGQIRSSIAAIDVATGSALAWSPDTLGPRFPGFPPPVVFTIAATRDLVYVGGWFETVGGASHPNVVALDAETGRATAWNPKPNIGVYAMALRGDTLQLCGRFTTLGEWRHRAGLAAIDLSSGTLKPWNPNPDGVICTAVVTHGGQVFVSGDFLNVGGNPEPRTYLAALDTINGEVTGWDPGGANDLTTRLLVRGDTLYAGGWFTQLGGLTRKSLAAMNTTTGEITSWAPSANDAVLAMAQSGNTIYAAGIFDGVNGTTRRGLAAVDALTGALLPWNPDADLPVIESVVPTGNTVYVGGPFTQIGGERRAGLAALDAETGLATSWNPGATNWDLLDPRIMALALAGKNLYVGGSFASAGGQPRICFAEVDTATGLATDWDPGADERVWSLLADGNTLFVGGGFTRVGGIPASGLAAFTLPSSPISPPTELALGQNSPNPTPSVTVIHYALPAASSVSLSVYDLQGRKIVTVLDHESQGAGPHEVHLQVASWKAGVYLYRLDVAGRSMTRKLVVVR
jgi:hypothetical protein